MAKQGGGITFRMMKGEEAKWEQIARCKRIVDRLGAPDAPMDEDGDDPMILNHFVCNVLLSENACRQDFTLLDEKPGSSYWGGYRFRMKEGEPSREWHWRLRRVRNRYADLFLYIRETPDTLNWSD